MSALGDRLREEQRRFSSIVARLAYNDAATLADTHEAAALAESAQGRGPHAAAALRWAAERVAQDDLPAGAAGLLRHWAGEAER